MHVVDSCSTHPAYWRAGHMSAALRHFLDIANVDDVDVGVLAQPMGQQMMQHLGFRGVGDIIVPGYEPEHPSDVGAWIGVWKCNGEDL